MLRFAMLLCGTAELTNVTVDKTSVRIPKEQYRDFFVN